MMYLEITSTHFSLLLTMILKCLLRSLLLLKCFLGTRLYCSIQIKKKNNRLEPLMKAYEGPVAGGAVAP